MQRFNNVSKASKIGIIGNLFLLIIKLIVGIITKSRAMMADALNSAGDIISSFMTFIGNKIASIPRDEDHNLGHGKAEYIYSMLISNLMILLSFMIFKDSILSIIYKSKYTFSYFLIIVCILTIITKITLYIYTKIIYKKHNNLLIKAAYMDHRNDILLTLMNLFSCILSYYGIYFVDGIVGILISLWIFYTSCKLFKESYDVLMDKSISLETKNEVLNIINNYKDVKMIKHFNSTPVGYKYQISFTIYVDGEFSTFKSHDIANSLEKEIDKKIDDIYLTVIHVNPINLNKKR